MNNYYLYVVLTRSKTAVSRLIHFIKHDQYTHASLALDKELCNMYSFGRKYARNPFIARFKQEPMDRGLYGLYTYLPGLIIELEVSQEQYLRARELIDHFVRHSTIYRYNYLGLVDSLISREAYYENRFLCSEFVYYILYESGIMDLNKSRNLVRPQDFLENYQKFNGEIIFEGNIKEFVSLDDQTVNL